MRSCRQSQLRSEVTQVYDEEGVVHPGGEDVVVVSVVVGLRLEVLVPGAADHHLAVRGQTQRDPGQKIPVRVCRDLTEKVI